MQPAGDEIHVWGVVPAAGRGRHMGCAKQTLPFGESTITGTVVRTALAAPIAGVVVVTRRDLLPALQLPTAERLHVAHNEDPDSEMITSVRIAIDLLASLGAADRDGVLVIPGDMPAVRDSTVRACVAAYRAARDHIVVAASEGRHGHPLVFPLALRGTVASLRGGLNQLAIAYADRLHVLEVTDSGIHRDVDIPADYQGPSDRWGGIEQVVTAPESPGPGPFLERAVGSTYRDRRLAAK